MLSSKNRKRTTISIFVAVIFVFVYYIINLAYNKTQYGQFESSLAINCITNICISYDNIKECIHIGTPTLFKIEINNNEKYNETGVKSIEYTAIKEGCK